MQSEDIQTFENPSSGAIAQEQNTFPVENQFNQENQFNNNGAFEQNNNMFQNQIENNMIPNDSLQQNHMQNLEGANADITNTLEWHLQRAREAGLEGQTQQMEMDKATSDTSDGDLRGELEMLMANEEEEEGGEKEPESKFRTKNEQGVDQGLLSLEETLEQRYQRLRVNPDDINHLVPVGRIEFIMSEFITVQSQADNVVDLDGILFVENKIPLGTIDDVFGQVDIPKYTVINDRFLKTRITNQEIKVGDVVYFDPLLSKVLPPMQIEIMKSRRGCDASNRFDEEALYEEEVEFSDDEKEQEFSRTKKQAKKEAKKSKHGQKQDQKEERQAHMLSSNTVYNQGRSYISGKNPHMFNSQMTPMNQLNQMNQMPQMNQMNYQGNQFQPMNQYPMNGMNGMMQMHPMQNMQQNMGGMPTMQNMPLFFNPMMGQGMNQQMQGGFQGYPQQQQQQQPQNFMPNNGLFQYNSYNNGGM